jgi:uncharacterized protein (DUF1330 family)
VTKAYWVNTFRSVRDPDKLAAYVELAGSAMRASGRRFLARVSRPGSSSQGCPRGL